MPEWSIRILESPEEMAAAEELQRLVWPGSDLDVVPAHLLLTAAHNGGLVLGAYSEERLVGMLFGFPGIEDVPDGPRPKHCSHMLGVHPDLRDGGLGFALKRAQWQMVRRQGLDHVTWTYDPLLSRNAYLNIARLGAVCSTYLRELYGDMRDGLNAGLPSDRFQVDWWILTGRVSRRLERRPRGTFNLLHFDQAGVPPLYDAPPGKGGWIRPPTHPPTFADRLALAEIPPDFPSLKAAEAGLARDWRLFSRELFEQAFSSGYLVTDFIFDRSGERPRSFYVLAHGESTLDDMTVRKKR
jgi:predicted GNAT superfamily acetyltransferase